MSFKIKNIDFDALISNEKADANMYRLAALRLSDIDPSLARAFQEIAHEEDNHSIRISGIKNRLMSDGIKSE